MRPGIWGSPTAGTCFPRVSGDAPAGAQALWTAITFSPRERGCAPGIGGLLLHERVFPA